MTIVPQFHKYLNSILIITGCQLAPRSRLVKAINLLILIYFNCITSHKLIKAFSLNISERLFKELQYQSMLLFNVNYFYFHRSYTLKILQSANQLLINRLRKRLTKISVLFVLILLI